MKRYWCVLALLLTTSLCQVFLDEKFETGIISLGDHRHNGELFYMLFKSRDENPTAPLVWFFEGGPGMSSMHSVFYQNGPFRLNPDLTLRKNEFSFNNIADVLYVDQPLGTGFSNCTNSSWIPHHEDIILADMVHFLNQFFERYPAYRGRPLYLVSQGYGSHFVLPFARMLTKHVVMFANVQGVAIGNPWIRPEIQLTSLASFTKRQELCTEFQYVASLYGYILASIFIDLDLDVAAHDLAQMATGVLVGVHNHKFNPYDMRIKCQSGSCLYNFSDLEKFLDKPDVRRIMNTVDRHFQYYSPEVYLWLVRNNEYFSDKSNALIDLLDNTPLPVYLFLGEQDWFINEFGMDNFIESLHWSGREQMISTYWRDWYSDGQWQGKYKRYRNFYYVHVAEAGHYVAMDLPSFTLDLLTRLVYGSN